MMYTAVKINRHKGKIVSYILKSETGTLKVSARDLKGLIQAGLGVSNLTLTSDGRLMRKKPAQTETPKQTIKEPETNAKYTLLKQPNMSITVNGRQLYRIRANMSFEDVKQGDIGGYIESVGNLSMRGTCWVYDNAKVMERACISDDAKVCGHAIVCTGAKVSGNAVVRDYAIIDGLGSVKDNATVRGRGKVCDWGEVVENAIVEDDAVIKKWARVEGSAIVCDRATLDDWATVKDKAVIREHAVLKQHAEVYGNAQVEGNTVLTCSAKAGGRVTLGGDTKVGGWNRICNTPALESSAKLGTLGIGEVFYDRKGNRYAVLEHLTNHATLVIACSPMGHKTAYDDRGGNDFKNSTLKTVLEDLASGLVDGCFPQGALKAHVQSLAPIDRMTYEQDTGIRLTDKYSGKLSLLTLSQFNKYQYCIPRITEDWWLLTPVVNSSVSAFNFLVSSSSTQFTQQAEAMCVDTRRPMPVPAPTTEEKAVRPIMVLDSDITVGLETKNTRDI